jgi:hypothetical protein
MHLILGAIRVCTFKFTTPGKLGTIPDKAALAYILNVRTIWRANYLLFTCSGN